MRGCLQAQHINQYVNTKTKMFWYEVKDYMDFYLSDGKPKANICKII